MSEPIKRIDAKEFQEVGFLQEANRQFFHPHGLALEVMVNDDGTVTLGGVWDYRDDPEGICFGDKPDREKAYRVAAERERHVQARIALMGDVVQPLDWSLNKDEPS